MQRKKRKVYEATQGPKHASNLTQIISHDKFTIRWQTADGDVAIKHVDFYGSVHTHTHTLCRCRTVTNSDAIVPIDNSSI